MMGATSTPYLEDITYISVVTLRPVMQIRAATVAEEQKITPWLHVSGESAVEVVAFADGGNRHAPEVVATLRALFNDTRPPEQLLYAHCGQKIESKMPLLPSLLFALGYSGPCCSLRISDLATDAEATLRAKRFAAGQVLHNGTAVLVIDRQRRLAPPGCLIPATVDILLLNRVAPRAATYDPLDRIAVAERPTQ